MIGKECVYLYLLNLLVCLSLLIFIAMINRRIVLRFDNKVFANLNFNHSTANKINNIVASKGITRVEFARTALKSMFNTSDNEELKERIIYATSIQDLNVPVRRERGELCKIMIKRFVDSY